MNKLEEVAESFLEFNTQTKILAALKSNIREQHLDAKYYRKLVYEKHLKMHGLKTWIKL